MPAGATLHFFIDNCVPDSVGRAATAAGHQVTHLRDVIASNSPDPVVATLCDQTGLILVSMDKDFDQLHSRIGIGRRRFRKLRRIKIACYEPQAAARFAVALSLIEHEAAVADQARDQRMIIEIGHTKISTIR